MFHQTSIVTNDTALEAFKELSKKVEYDGNKFVGTDFFNESEILEGLDNTTKYLIARSKVEVVDGSINRKYYLEHYPVQLTLHTEATDIPLTKNELTMSEVTGDVIIVMKKTGVDSHKYPANVPALFSIKDSKDTLADGKLAVMVDGELRAEFAKNSDGNYLGLITYGHPGQLDNYTLSNISASDSQATISLRNGSSSIKDLWDVWGNSFQPSSNLLHHSVALTFNLKGTGVSNIMPSDKTMIIHATGSDLAKPTLDLDTPMRTPTTEYLLDNGNNPTESGQVIYYTERIDPTDLSIDEIEEKVVLDLANALNVECKQANLTTGDADAFTVSGNTITCTLNPSVLSLSYTSTSYTTNITYKITIKDVVNNTLKVNYVNPNALVLQSAPFSGQVDFGPFGGKNTNAKEYREVINSVFSGLAVGLGLKDLNEIGFIDIDIDDNTLYITLHKFVVPVWFEGTGITITTLYGNKDNKLDQIPSITNPSNINEAYGIFNQWGPKTLGAFSLRTDEEKLKMTFQFNSEDKEWPHSKITLESKGFESYFHALVDNYYALKAEGALYRNDKGTITPLELTLQALTEFNYITLTLGAVNYISFNVFNDTITKLQNDDVTKGKSNLVLQQQKNGNWENLSFNDIHSKFTIFYESLNMNSTDGGGSGWVAYSAPFFGQGGGWESDSPLPIKFQAFKYYITLKPDVTFNNNLRLVFNGTFYTTNNITIKSGINNLGLPIRVNDSPKKLKTVFSDIVQNPETDHDKYAGDFINIKGIWTAYSKPFFGQGGGWESDVNIENNNYIKYYRSKGNTTWDLNL